MTDSDEWQKERLIERLELMAAVTERLAQEVERLQRWHPLAGDLRHLLWRSFLRGVAWGLGHTVGATLILALLVWLLGRLQVVPVLGAWIVRVMEAVQAAQQGF